MLADTSSPALRAWYRETGIMPRGKPVNRNVNPALQGSQVNRWHGFGNDSADSALCWSNVDAEAIGNVVHAVCRIGDAVLFGVVSGGGSLVVTICSGDQRIRRYCKSINEAEILLAEIENVASDRAGD